MYQLPSITDDRGIVSILDQNGFLNFCIRRVFYIQVGGTEGRRGTGASTAIEIVVPIVGGFCCALDNGTQQASVSVDAGWALKIAPGVWHELGEFQNGTLILAMSDQAYKDVTVYPDPFFAKPKMPLDA